MTMQYLSLHEIAERSGYTRATVTYWIQKGQFKKGTLFKRGNLILVEKKEAERIIKEKSTPTPIN